MPPLSLGQSVLLADWCMLKSVLFTLTVLFHLVSFVHGFIFMFNWSCGTRPGTARMSDLGPPSSRLTTHRRVQKGLVQCDLGGSRGRGPRWPNPRRVTLAMGTWNITSLGGKEPELVREAERYRLEIVGLTSTHSLGSGTQLLERGWTLFYSGVARSERLRAGVGLLIAPQLSCHVLAFSPGEREGRFPAPSGRG